MTIDEQVIKLIEMGAPKDAEILWLKEQLRLAIIDKTNTEAELNELRSEVSKMRMYRCPVCGVNLSAEVW